LPASLPDKDRELIRKHGNDRETLLNETRKLKG
jgi:hypothetical protein